VTISLVCKDRSKLTIQRFFWRTSTVIMITTVLVAFVSGCSPTSTQPTAVLPTFSSGDSISSAPTNTVLAVTLISPTHEPDRVWSEQAVGTERVIVSFYSNDTQKCIRLTIQSAQTDRCERSDAGLVAVQSILTDSGGQAYTIVAGRILRDAITVVSIELDRGDNTPAELSDAGFFVVLPGKRTVISVVPIDQYGNLVGVRYLFR
jgi:hypothetical protein